LLDAKIMKPTSISTVLEIDPGYAEASEGMRLSKEKTESSG